MKTSRIVLLLALLPVLVSCDFFAPGKFCAKRHVHVKLKGGDETKPAFLEIKPAQISVKQGCTFKIKFSGGITLETKSGEMWLRKGATDVSPIMVSVPMAQGKGIYKYNIEVAGFGMLDPRARVK